MKVIVPDKDTLFFLRERQVSLIQDFNCRGRGMLYPVLPLVFIPEENDCADVSSPDFFDGFSGCEYSGFYEKDGRILIKCMFLSADKNESFYSEAAFFKPDIKIEKDFLDGTFFKKNACIIRTADMDREKESWSFSGERFYRLSLA